MNKKWLLKAMVLGLAFFAAILLKKPIGVSTQFNVASGLMEYAVNRDIIREEGGVYSSDNAYYNASHGKLAKAIAHPINYGFVFVLSIFLGAFVGHRILGKKDATREPISREKSWKDSNGIYFLGGCILLFGARFAGGCTSGHMMSGIMQGAISGMVFAGIVFAFAILTAIVKERV
ncbi:MAG: YeeE/YedE thiosulfate transporter family protein [Tissierellia bacterium]|nr:YeeE/YedE thiosulfate transporter family protein [Tissierellia bacterium]